MHAVVLAMLLTALLGSTPGFAEQVFVLKNQQTSHYLTVEQSNVFETDDGNQPNAAWSMEPAGFDEAAGANLVRLKSQESGSYLNVQSGALQASPVELDWLSALWLLQPAGENFRIQNAQDKNLFLTMVDGSGQALAVDAADMASLWSTHALPVGSVSEQGMPEDAPAQSEPATSVEAPLPEPAPEEQAAAPEAAILPEPAPEEQAAAPEAETLPEPAPEEQAAAPEAETLPEPAPEEQAAAPEAETLPEPIPEEQAIAPDEALLPEPAPEEQAAAPEQPLLPEAAPEEQIAAPEETLLPEPTPETLAAAPEETLLPEPEPETLAAAPDETLLPEPEPEQQVAAAEPAPKLDDEISIKVTPLAPVALTEPEVPDGHVLMLMENRSDAPMDVFVEPEGGGEPAFVMTINQGFLAMQPTPPGRKWRVAQNDAWKGGFVPTAEPRQRFTYPQPE